MLCDKSHKYSLVVFQTEAATVIATVLAMLLPVVTLATVAGVDFLFLE